MGTFTKATLHHASAGVREFVSYSFVLLAQPVEMMQGMYSSTIHTVHHD